MAIYFSPPNPFIGGSQPLDGRGKVPVVATPVAVNDPPFGVRPWLMAAVLAWQVWSPLPQQAARLPQGSTANNPPFAVRAWLPTVLRSWDPAPPLPRDSRRVPPPGSSVDGPPFATRPWLSVALESWRLPPSPVIARNLSPGLPGQSVDPPPPTSRLWLPAVTEAWRQIASPQTSRPSAATLGVASNDPPFGQRPWLYGVVTSWQVAPPSVQQRPGVSQAPAADSPVGLGRSWLPTVVASWQVTPLPVLSQRATPQGQPEDNPPFGQRTWLSSVLASWQEIRAPLPARNVQPPTTVNDPPFGSRPWLSAALSSWQQDFPRQTGKPVAPLPSVDNPPFGPRAWLPGLIQTWQSAVPIQPIPPRVTTSVDNPPFGLRQWLSVVLHSWQAAPPTIVSRNLSPGVPGPSVDAPPPYRSGRIAEIASSWQAGFTPVPASRFIAPLSAPADNPPFGLRPWLPTVISTWAPSVLPTLPRLSVQVFAAPVNNPPFGQRRWLTAALQAWNLPPIRTPARLGTPPPAVRDSPEVFSANVQSLEEEEVFNLLYSATTPPAASGAPPFSIKAISFTTDGSATQTVTGVGFRGKAGIFFTVGTTPAQDSVVQDDQHVCIGMCSGTGASLQRYALVRSPNGSSPASCVKEFGDGVFGIMDSPTTIAQAGRVTSWIDDGFIISKPVNVSSGYRIYGLIFGGSDFEKIKVGQIDVDATVPNSAFTGFGFLPTFAFFLGVRGSTTASLPSNLDLDNHSTLTLGATTSPTSRWAIANSGQNTAATTSTLGAVSSQVTNKCLQMLSVTSTPIVEKYADLVSFDSDGFTLDQVEVSASSQRRSGVMLLRGPQVAVGSFNRITAPIVSGLAFAPTAVILASFHQAATTSVGGDSQICFGVSDGTTQSAIWTRLTDNAMPIVSKRIAVSGKSFVSVDGTPSIDAEATIALTSDGFSMSSSPVGTIDDQICYIAIGPAIPSTLPPDTGSVFDDMTVPFNVPEVAKPAYLTPLLEPTFQDFELLTPTVTRIADTPGNTAVLRVLPLPAEATYTMTWGGRARHVYSKQQPWNSDQSLYLMENRQSDPDNPVHIGDPNPILLDGRTMVPKYKFGPVAKAARYDMRWHPLYSNILVNVTADGKTLQWIDVLADTVTRSWDLSSVFPAGFNGIGSFEGNLSDDGRYVALFREVDPLGVTSNDADVVIVDMDAYPGGIGPVYHVVSTDAVSVLTNRVVTWSTISPDGNYVLLHWRGDKVSVYSVNKTALTMTPIDYTGGAGFGSGADGDAWASADYACTTNGTATVTSVGLFSGEGGMKGMMVKGGLVGTVPTTVYVVAVASDSSLTVSQALDAGSPTLRIGDEADKGYIWRLGHGDVSTNPYDSDTEVMVGRDARLAAGNTFNGRDISNVLMIRLSDASLTSLTSSSIGGVSEGPAHHVSTRNKGRPGWVYVSYIEKSTSTDKLYQQEIIAVKMVANGAAPSLTGNRFAHHHSDESTLGGNPSSTYQAEPHAVPSWDGSRIAFASDWARQCDAGCGDNSYLGAFPNGVYQDYIIQAFIETSIVAPESVEASSVNSANEEGFTTA